ncbi:MAG: hypothetical protein ACJ71S_08115, partial [Acidobacteriaceae bacterium]
TGPSFFESGAIAQQQTPLQVVTAMVQNEKHARQHPTFFRYTSVERSTRTGGHLWTENVVETSDGLLRRLIAEDGKPLSADRATAENRRISALVADPSALRAANADRRADEERLGKLLDVLPKTFLFSADGMQGDCVRIAFRPNPDFSPSTYADRIVHGLAGTILIRMPAERLCGIEGHLVDRVSFGFGLLGHIDPSSHFRVERVPVTATDWKSAHIDVHVDGKVLLLKSISRDQNATHSGATPIPPNLSLAQAAALTQPTSPSRSGQ